MALPAIAKDDADQRLPQPAGLLSLPLDLLCDGVFAHLLPSSTREAACPRQTFLPVAATCRELNHAVARRLHMDVATPRRLTVSTKVLQWADRHVLLQHACVAGLDWQENQYEQEWRGPPVPAHDQPHCEVRGPAWRMPRASLMHGNLLRRKPTRALHYTFVYDRTLQELLEATHAPWVRRDPLRPQTAHEVANATTDACERIRRVLAVRRVDCVAIGDKAHDTHGKFTTKLYRILLRTAWDGFAAGFEGDEPLVLACACDSVACLAPLNRACGAEDARGGFRESRIAQEMRRWNEQLAWEAREEERLEREQQREWSLQERWCWRLEEAALRRERGEAPEQTGMPGMTPLSGAQDGREGTARAPSDAERLLLAFRRALRLPGSLSY